jgi:hypothetical protein
MRAVHVVVTCAGGTESPTFMVGPLGHDLWIISPNASKGTMVLRRGQRALDCHLRRRLSPSKGAMFLRRVTRCCRSPARRIPARLTRTAEGCLLSPQCTESRSVTPEPAYRSDKPDDRKVNCARLRVLYRGNSSTWTRDAPDRVVSRDRSARSGPHFLEKPAAVGREEGRGWSIPCPHWACRPAWASG